MMVEEVMQFIKDFVIQEYDVLVQMRSESNTSLIEHNLNNLNQLFQGLHSGIKLPSSRTLENRDAVMNQLQPRVIFKIEKYAHVILGAVYRVYLSSPYRGDHNYFTNLFIAITEKGMKIIARYNLCNYCDGIGKRAGSLCDECHGLGWNWRGGHRLESLGELVAVQQFTTP